MKSSIIIVVLYYAIITRPPPQAPGYEATYSNLSLRTGPACALFKAFGSDAGKLRALLTVAVAVPRHCSCACGRELSSPVRFITKPTAGSR